MDKAIKETSEIQEQLQSTLKTIQLLSSKYKTPAANYLYSILPDGDSSAFPEYLTINIDAFIKEQQQRHQMPSENLLSGILTPPNETIDDDDDTAKTFVNSKLFIDGDATGQEKSLKLKTGSTDCPNYIHIMRFESSNRYNKVDFKKIKLKFEIQSAIIGVQRAINLSQMQSKKANNYLSGNHSISKDSSRKRVFSCNRNFSPRIVSTPLCKANRSIPESAQVKKPSWNITPVKSYRKVSESKSFK